MEIHAGDHEVIRSILREEGYAEQNVYPTVLGTRVLRSIYSLAAYRQDRPSEKVT